MSDRSLALPNGSDSPLALHDRRGEGTQQARGGLRSGGAGGSAALSGSAAVGGGFGCDLVGLEGGRQVVLALWEGDAQLIGTSRAFSQEKSGPDQDRPMTKVTPYELL